MIQVNFEIDEDLHKQFKIKCIEEGIFMQDKIVKFINDFVGDTNASKKRG